MNSLSRIPRPLLWREQLKAAQLVQPWLPSSFFFTVSFTKVLSVVSLDLITSLRAENTQWDFGQGLTASGKQQHMQIMTDDALRTVTGSWTKRGCKWVSLPFHFVSSVLQEADKRAALSTKLKDSKTCLYSCQGQRRDWKLMFSVFGMILFR